MRLNVGHGPDDKLNLNIEVTGEKRADKEMKVATARDLCVPAVNNHGGFGKWAFQEMRDPWNAKNDFFNEDKMRMLWLTVRSSMKARNSQR